MRAPRPRLAGRHRRADAVPRGPRRTRWRPRRGRRRRPRPPACRAATACRAARPRRRRRRGRGAAPTRGFASADPGRRHAPQGTAVVPTSGPLVRGAAARPQPPSWADSPQHGATTAVAGPARAGHDWTHDRAAPTHPDRPQPRGPAGHGRRWSSASSRQLPRRCSPSARRHGFHARVDLPPRSETSATVVRLLLAPVRRHRVPRRGVRRVRPRRPRLVGARAAPPRHHLHRPGVRVVEVLRAYERPLVRAAVGRRWGEGVPYDVSAHPFVAEAVLRGRGHPRLAGRPCAATVRPDPVRSAWSASGWPVGGQRCAPEARAAGGLGAWSTVAAAGRAGRVRRPDGGPAAAGPCATSSGATRRGCCMSRSNARGTRRAVDPGRPERPRRAAWPPPRRCWRSRPGSPGTVPSPWCALDRCRGRASRPPDGRGASPSCSAGGAARGVGGRVEPARDPVPDRA